MPLYEYENTEHDIKVDMPFPVDARPDTIVLTRRQVPSRVTVGVGAQPPNLNDKMRAGYKKLEAEGGLKDAPGYLPASAVKKALEMPVT